MFFSADVWRCCFFPADVFFPQILGDKEEAQMSGDFPADVFSRRFWGLKEAQIIEDVFTFYRRH